MDLVAKETTLQLLWGFCQTTNGLLLTSHNFDKWSDFVNSFTILSKPVVNMTDYFLSEKRTKHWFNNCLFAAWGLVVEIRLSGWSFSSADWNQLRWHLAFTDQPDAAQSGARTETRRVPEPKSKDYGNIPEKNSSVRNFMTLF